MCVIPFQNNPKSLDLSHKTDLDFLDCFRRKNCISLHISHTNLHICEKKGKLLSYNGINMVFTICIETW